MLWNIFHEYAKFPGISISEFANSHPVFSASSSFYYFLSSWDFTIPPNLVPSALFISTLTRVVWSIFNETLILWRYAVSLKLKHYYRFVIDIDTVWKGKIFVIWAILFGISDKRKN